MQPQSDGAGETTQSATSTQAVVDQAKQTAQEVVEQAKQQANSRLASQIEQASQNLAQASDAIRTLGRQLREQGQAPVAQYADQAAGQVERASAYLRGKDLERLIGDVEQFARQRPAVFVGGAVALGLVASRFLKSSTQSQGMPGGTPSQSPAPAGPSLPQAAPSYPPTGVASGPPDLAPPAPIAAPPPPSILTPSASDPTTHQP